MARTVGFAGGDLIKQKISERQTNYQLNLKSGLKIKLTDTKATAPVESANKGTRLNAEGGWQPEINDLSGNTAVVLEAIRTLAANECSAASIAQGMAELLPQELAGATVDISSLSEDVKSCLSR
ncbi:hypothetical protein D3C72_2056020 [compost metagenome]